MAANNSKSTNYWLGGFWTNGVARGLIWRRGEWSGGEWRKGQWHSNTLAIEWKDNDINKNKWSIWKSGIWKSNSVEEYSFADFKLGEEYSVWHGGTWYSVLHDGSTYTWQGENVVDRISVYGVTNVYECDTLPYQTNKRQILLPNSNSLFLGGQWLRGEWHGGIFANSVWHSLIPYEVKISYLDDVFFLYEHEEYSLFQNNDPEYSEINNDYSILNIDQTGNIVETNDTIILYSTYFKAELSYFDDLNYSKTASIFTSGAVVNSIWEGGTVVDDGSKDPYNIMFGMSLSKSNNIIYDDSEIQPSNGYGIYESVNLIHSRFYGLRLPDWKKYLTTSDYYKIIKIVEETDQYGNVNNKYVLPTSLSDTHLYSNIWKRGDFQHGVFSYGQFYDYNIRNTVNTEYVQDPNINNLGDLDRFNNYDSLFRKGLFYKSVFYGGTFLAQFYDDKTEKIKSVFDRSIWATGYWAATIEHFYNLPDRPLPVSINTDNEYITNAKFWKSVWLNGIWEGGRMSLSAWNCVNPFNYDITLNNETFAPSVQQSLLSSLIFNNIYKNPLGKINDLTYYDNNNNNELYEEYQNIVTDLNRIDFLNIINKDLLTNLDIVVNKKYIYLLYFNEDEYIDPADPDLGDPNNPEAGMLYSIPYDDNTPLDFILFGEEDSTYDTSGAEIVAPNFNNKPIECTDANFQNCPSWSDYVQGGLIMLLDEDTYLNDDITNENIFRTLGLVHNPLSVWQNGVFEGGVWNGGLWLKGEFMPYTYANNYPEDEVFDYSGNAAVYDYFDDNIVHIHDRYDNAIWTRGLFYGGYFHSRALFFAIPAYITDTGLYQITVDLNYKLCLIDTTVESHFNNTLTDILQLKPLNFVSIFTRKLSRGGNPEYKMFSVMNGHFMSGYLQDRLQTDVKDVPVIGTTAFPEDVNEQTGVNKLTFGKYRVTNVYDEPTYNRGIVITDDVEYISIKNTSEGVSVNITVAEPVLYDPINGEYNYTIETGRNSYNPPDYEPITNKFYYDYHSITGDIVPVNRANIKHAIEALSNLQTEQPDWTDIEMEYLLGTNVPSWAQGAGIRPEPYYTDDEIK